MKTLVHKPNIYCDFIGCNSTHNRTHYVTVPDAPTETFNEIMERAGFTPSSFDYEDSAANLAMCEHCWEIHGLAGDPVCPMSCACHGVELISALPMLTAALLRTLSAVLCTLQIDPELATVAGCDPYALVTRGLELLPPGLKESTLADHHVNRLISEIVTNTTLLDAQPLPVSEPMAIELNQFWTGRTVREPLPVSEPMAIELAPLYEFTHGLESQAGEVDIEQFIASSVIPLNPEVVTALRGLQPGEAYLSDGGEWAVRRTQ